MSYLDILKSRIAELENQIANNLGEKSKLQEELQMLLKRELEESLREETSQRPQLLQE
jgi:hypothetical protein